MAIKDWAYPAECNGMDPLGNLRPCQLGPAKDRGVLFLGDSYAQQIFGRFVENAKLNPENSFTFLTSAGCPPITGLRIVMTSCTVTASSIRRCNLWKRGISSASSSSRTGMIILIPLMAVFVLSKEMPASIHGPVALFQVSRCGACLLAHSSPGIQESRSRNCHRWGNSKGRLGCAS